MPSSEYNTEVCRSALDELLVQMSLDYACTWNNIELYSLYCELGGTKLLRRTLIKTVHDYFHPNLLVLSYPGIASILVFRSKASHYLRFIDDAQDDSDTQAISVVANKIKAECLKLKRDNHTYPTRTSMSTALSECSDTLLSLLAAISPKLNGSMEAAMMGNIITSVVNNQTIALQLSLSVLLNQKRKLVDQFHNFGVTSSYNELQRFKISCASSIENLPSLRLFDSTNGLVQVVADNFDTEISSQNGQKLTHGLAMIITQVGQPKPEVSYEIYEIPTIKRLNGKKQNPIALHLGK